MLGGGNKTVLSIFYSTKRRQDICCDVFLSRRNEFSIN